MSKGKNSDKRRLYSITIRLNALELQLIEKRAKEAKKMIRPFCRSIIIDKLKDNANFIDFIIKTKKKQIASLEAQKKILEGGRNG